MITSKSNEYIKFIKLLHQKKYREEYQLFFVEGIKMVKEAIVENMPIKKIVICPELLQDDIDTKKYEILEVSKTVFEYIADTKTPQGIMAVIHIRSDAHYESQQTIFALDNIQDPGNLGTIIRTLDCANIHTLLLSEDTVDVYNPKVIRSTMGAIYRVNVQEQKNLKETLQELKKEGYQIVVTDISTQKYHYELDFEKKMVIVIGNEANGVSESIKNVADIKVKIPMFRKNRKLKCRCGSQYNSL